MGENRAVTRPSSESESLCLARFIDRTSTTAGAAPHAISCGTGIPNDLAGTSFFFKADF
jgi:hypothetical protein